MKIYSIVRVGNEFVVQAGDESVLKIASRRRAVQLVSDAAELLDLQAAPRICPQEPIAPSSPMIPEMKPVPREVS